MNTEIKEHYAPLNARLFNSFNSIAIQASRYQPAEWKGHVFKLLLKGCCTGGHLLNIPLALIEGCAAFSLGLIGLLFLSVGGGQKKGLHTYTALSTGIALQSFLTIILTAFSFKKNSSFHSHTHNALANRLSSLASVVLAQLVLKKILKEENQDLSLPIFILEQLTTLLGELVEGCRRDQTEGSVPRLGGYLVQFEDVEVTEETYNDFCLENPQYLETLSGLNISQLGDEIFQIQLSELFFNFLSYCNFELQNEQDLGEVREVIMNNLQPEETAYQNRLMDLVKRTLVEVHADPDYIMAFGETEKAGKEAIEFCFDHVYVPLANVVQLREIEGEIQCPIVFGEELEAYNKRREELVEAKQLLAALSADQKSYLIWKLLIKEQCFTAQIFNEGEKAQVHALFLKISALAGALHQGSLMSQRTMTVGDEVEFGGNNLFQKGYQQGLQKL